MLEKLLFIFIIFIDRITKNLAISTLYNNTITVFPGCNLLLRWNRGISWSLFHDHEKVTTIVLYSIIVCTIFCFAIYTFKRIALWRSSLPEILILSGAISNMIDRLYYGAVIDFIELYIGNYTWPVFNIADTSIVIGAILIIVRTFRQGDNG